MAFVVFDATPGADNSGATSYGSVAGLRAYALARNKTVPVSDPDCQVVLTKSMDWLEARAGEYQGMMAAQADTNEGTTVLFAQNLQWPRAYVLLYNSQTEFDRTLLPPMLLNSQFELACILAGGVELFPVLSGSFIKSEKVDVIETVYSEIINTSGLPQIPSVEAILGPLLIGKGNSQIRVVRA